MTLEPYILQAFDFGYASEDHDGPNHFQAGLDMTLELTEQVRAIASIAHSWAQEDVENDDLGDEFWGSVGLSVDFQ